MKKLLSLLSVLTISVSAIPNVIAVKPYELEQFDSIYKKIKKWNLGELSNNLPETILNRIYKLNKNIKKNSIRIINVQQNTAKIIWDEDDDNTTNFINVFLQLSI